MAQAKSVVLVTGGAGYIGSHVVLALLDSGHQVVVIDNLSTGARSAVDPRATFVLAEVEDVPTVTSVMQRAKAEAVIHMAASISAEDSLARPLDYYRNNTAVTVAVLESCLKAGVGSFVFSSSAAVYGAPPQPLIDETTVAHPATPYGASKLMSERIIADAALAHAIRHCSLRYFNVAGADAGGRAGQGPAARSLIKLALDTALGRRDLLLVYGADFDTKDGSGVRDYVHVADLAAAHVLVLQRLMSAAPVPEVLNCGYGRGYTVFEVIEAVRRVTGRPAAWQLAPRRPGDLAAVVADSTRIKALGWTPVYDNIEAMIAHAYEWELASSFREPARSEATETRPRPTRDRPRLPPKVHPAMAPQLGR
ncbi:UDP-glucose 4-epimerase GalE [Phenylobacterium sp.]|uniref:UDP-glucose 4-epimerase GalE n=1 Tax=Phenylobacterium sp. TaxID=1871053 RepID=UPI003783EEF3